MSIESQLAEGLAEMGVALDDARIRTLADYLRLIEKWNKVHNLTAVREPERMVALHILDSLSALDHLSKARTVLDVGTGAGLPGIPLAIARPDLAVTLLDSSHKKAAFLRQAKAELGIANVEIACQRVESWQPEHRFDVVVSRALSELPEFVAMARHLVAPEGLMLAMKGVRPVEEIARIPRTHRVAEVVALRIPTVDAERHLVLVKAA